MLALSNIQWVGAIWLGVCAAIPAVLWLVRRNDGRIQYNELEQTAPRPPAFPRCLPTETWMGWRTQTPAAKAEINALRAMYNMPSADIDH
jgi:hypothetical protein